MMAQTSHTYKYYDANNVLVKTKVLNDPAYPFQKWLHMNWGWGGRNNGSNNGWYNAAVSYAQSGPSQTDFGFFQTIIYNIHP